MCHFIVNFFHFNSQVTAVLNLVYTFGSEQITQL